jgi:feruloyl esterase
MRCVPNLRSGLADNVLNLSRLRQKRDEMMANLAEPLRLKLVAPSGSNPGELRMLTYVPPGLPAGAPLVVVLHGCTQNAAAYDHGSGWSTLAERHGFAVLLPEQQRSNNGQLCFNWFQPQDVTRGQGEVESIRQMIEQMLLMHTLDARRVFVTGLSAGGAMTAAMLATSPELFAGGAIIAGLPYAAASGMMEAFTAMGQVRRHDAVEWGNLVRAASDHRGRFPAVQVWQGSADDTVNPGNADQLVLQWTNVLGLPSRPDETETVDGAEHQVWRRDGHPVLERWLVPGLAHGTPILADGSDADRTVGNAGPYMLASGIGSTWHLARSWGLLTQAARPRTASPRPAARAVPEVVAKPLSAAGSMIEKAMRAAGLLG